MDPSRQQGDTQTPGTQVHTAEHEVIVPGDDMTLKQKALTMGAGLMQSFAPVKKIHEHVCAFHFYAHDMSRQVEAHHFCSHRNADMRQCVIYDSAEPDAKLIGIEYVISEKLYKGLPEDEKKMWHSHRYEVSSGLLYGPKLLPAAEKEVMKELQNTYGKTWHLWQVDRGDTLPLGPAQLMMSFTEDGQIDPEAVARRDARCGKNTAEVRQQRADMKFSEVHPAADSWKCGKAPQVEMREVPVKQHKLLLEEYRVSSAVPGGPAGTVGRSPQEKEREQQNFEQCIQKLNVTEK